MKTFLRHTKIFFTNSISLSLVLINLVLAIWGLILKAWNYQIFHWYYESLPSKIVVLINLPAILIEESLSNSLFAFEKPQLSAVIFYPSEFALVIIFSILQWLIIGYVIYLCKLAAQKELI